MLEKVKVAIADELSHNPDKRMQDITVACLGLAFKPDIDDLRESPAVELTQMIAGLGCRVIAVEPNINALPHRLDEGDVSLGTLEEALSAANVTCLLVKHSEFKNNVEKIKSMTSLIDVIGL